MSVFKDNTVWLILIWENWKIIRPLAECSCKDGFYGDGETCTDVDECAEGIHNCGDNADCQNFPSGFKCVCSDGFSGDGFTCVDQGLNDFDL